jgi:hypothetical protein
VLQPAVEQYGTACVYETGLRVLGYPPIWIVARDKGLACLLKALDEEKI